MLPCSATYLDDAADGAAGSLQDVLETLAAGGRLIGNGAFDELARGVGGNLAAYENMGASLDCLRLYCKSILVSGLNFPARGQSRGASAVQMPPRKHGTDKECRAAMMGLCMTMKGPNSCTLESKTE